MHLLKCVVSGVGLWFTLCGGKSDASPFEPQNEIEAKRGKPAHAALPVIEFTTNEFTVHENEREARITVRRTGGNTSEASVHFSTSDGSATEGHDYHRRAGVLRFEEGDSTKTIHIRIVRDGVVEGPETLRITLDDPKH